MAELALGALAAVVASALFSVGLLLQAIEARTIPAEHALRLELLRRLVRRKRWVLGGLVMVAGFTFHVGALFLAPLAVVQPSLSAGLVVLLAYGVRTGVDRIGRREVLGVAAVSIGVVVLTLTASDRSLASTGTLALVLGFGGLGAIALLPHLAALTGRRSSATLALLATAGAGAAYSFTGLTTKLVSDQVDAGDWIGVALWMGLTALGAVLALVDQTTALHGRPATQVGVVVYVAPVVVPVILSPLVLGDSWGEEPVLLALAVATVSAGAALLAGSRGVTEVEHPAPAG